MSSWLKTLLVLALVVPMTAYVAGSLVASGAGRPADRGPVIIEDPSTPTPERSRRFEDEPAGNVDGGRRSDRPTRVVPPTATPAQAPLDDDDDDPQEDHSAQVVTPTPAPVNDDAGSSGSRDQDDDTTGGDDDDEGDGGDDEDGDD